MPEPIIVIDRDGLRRASMVAQWELGDPSWAEVIVSAYLDPHDPTYQEAETEIGSEPQWRR